jgi:hypothetical protein
MGKKQISPEKRARLAALIDEAMVDAYDEEEQFMGMVYTLEEHLNFPFQAKVMGDVVEVVGIDDRRSDLRRGIMAKARKGGKEHAFPLSELEPLAPDETTAEWLEAYRYWLSKE